jgi:hypothetical protein
MRERFLESLELPRRYIRSNLNHIDCVHAGNYKCDDTVCKECEWSDECAWLYENDEYSGVAQKCKWQLMDALQYSVEYIDMQLARLEHDIGRCECEACKWLMDTEKLILQHKQ